MHNVRNRRKKIRPIYLFFVTHCLIMVYVKIINTRSIEIQDIYKCYAQK